MTYTIRFLKWVFVLFMLDIPFLQCQCNDMFKALIELPLCPRRPWVLPADDPLATLKFKEQFLF